jgi:hypothetical protein
MTTRVIHFGPDDCHRLMVLRSAGYFVDACWSLGQLRASLLTGGEIEAVFMSEREGIAPDEAVSLAKTHCAAPVVLFRSTNRAYPDSTFDLVVHALTPPEVWLKEIDALIGVKRGGQSSRLFARDSVQWRRHAVRTSGGGRSKSEYTRRVSPAVDHRSSSDSPFK